MAHHELAIQAGIRFLKPHSNWLGKARKMGEFIPSSELEGVSQYVLDASRQDKTIDFVTPMDPSAPADDKIAHLEARIDMLTDRLVALETKKGPGRPPKAEKPAAEPVTPPEQE